MTPERWQKVKEIFAAALKIEPAQRSPFLSRACGGDDDLRQEVESLIASHEKPGTFIDSPAYQAAAELIVKVEIITFAVSVGIWVALDTSRAVPAIPGVPPGFQFAELNQSLS